MNSSHERAEEEEELEDQKRRNEELGHLLQNAFDDLEDDETTIDSTTNFHSDLLQDNKHKSNEQQYPNDAHDMNDFKKNTLAAYDSEIHKLHALLESRTNELENIKQMAKEEFAKRDELQKRLSITEAELDRALAAKQNTHELLVESKEKCSNLENTLKKLRLERKALEDEHNTVLGKLETCQTLLADVQRKYDMVERDLNRNNDRNVELKRKHQDERHRAEIELLQQKLEQLDEKLQKKSQELENMNARYQALQNTHDIMLVEKGSKINELNSALHEAQKKCEELLRKEDYFQENVRLQKLVASLQEQIMGMERTIGSLNEKLQTTTAEIDVMDSILQQHNLEGTPRRLSQTQGKVYGSTPMNALERVGSLKDELYRALASVKSKREEVRKLQQTIEEKNSEIHQLKMEENKSLVLITTLREDKTRLENRLKVMEEEFAETRRDEHNNSLSNNSKLLTLTDELKQLRGEYDEMTQKHNELSDSLAASEVQRKQLDMSLKNAQVDLEELKQEHDSMKLNYEQLLRDNQQLKSRRTADNLSLELEKHKYLLKDAQAECERLKKLYVEISNAKETLSFELEQLRNSDTYKELQEQLDKVANLQRSVQLAEMKASELSKIIETEKLCHERELSALREKLEKEKTNHQLKVAKDNANNCTKCMDHLAIITKHEIEQLKLSQLSTMRQKEIERLNQELAESKSLIAELSEKLKLSDQQEQLIKELKTKATQFEDYIKSQSVSSASERSPTKQHNKSTGTTTSDKSVATSPELTHNEVKKIEARIRDEMAKIFATEMKRYQLRLKQVEEQYLNVQQEYQHINGELQQRQTEVQLLKKAILAERDKIEEMLRDKDEECKSKIQKHNQMLLKCRDELQLKCKRVAELSKELEERQKQIEAERQSMKVCMSQWEAQRKNVDMVEAEWRDKLEELKKSHESAMASWQSKYNSAKHTARNYKRYSEDKEAHMLKEYERIKLEYDTTITKLEARLHEELQNREREMKETIAAMERKRLEQQDNKENRIRN